MRKSKTQKIVAEFLKKRKISRNYVIRKYFSTHLNDIIYDLRCAGYIIEGQFENENRTGDYIYKLILAPIENLATGEISTKQINKIIKKLIRNK